jgi:curved DNA-binding protein CbpA
VDETIVNQAFEVLGIDPTTDDRSVRAAFLRMARIYHPDRFSGLPEDVRDEAERRMKDATVAYDLLRSLSAPRKRGRDPFDEAEIRARAQLLRDAIDDRRKRDERDRERWARWDEVERRARERAAEESEMAVRIKFEAGVKKNGSIDITDPVPIEERSYESLKERLDAARRSAESALSPRKDPGS